MKIKRLILKDLKLPIDAPGKSWGVPMKGDIMMVFDLQRKNQYYVIKSIKHVPEGTRYSLEPTTTLAADSRIRNGYCCYTVSIIEEMGYPNVEFFKLNEE